MTRHGRTVSLGTSARALIALSVGLPSAACSNTDSLGSAGACFAAESDDEEQEVFAREESRVGVSRVPPEDELGAPLAFEECAQGMRQVGELLDENGARFWLAIDARLADEELLPSTLFSVIDDARIDVDLQRGFASSDTVTIRSGGRLLVALQRNDALRSPPGSLTVEDGGSDALPSPQGCGPATTHRLTFTDDSGAQSVGNGSRAELVVDGTEFLGYNIFSADYASSGCEDGPFNGLHVTWVAVDNSF